MPPTLRDVLLQIARVCVQGGVYDNDEGSDDFLQDRSGLYELARLPTSDEEEEDYLCEEMELFAAGGRVI